MKSEQNQDTFSIRGKLISFASNFIAGILVLAFLGYQLDKYLETDSHLYLLVGVLLGFVWSMYETFKLAKLLNQPKGPDNSDHE